jgi:pyrimidine deaminase RibD-like protein
MNVDLKQFKKDVNAMMKSNDYIVSINLHQVDNGTHAFVNALAVQLSWGKTALSIFAPRLFTFTIPYNSMVFYTLHETPELRGITVTLTGKQLLSIRERQ